MRDQLILLAVLAPLAATGCKQIECAEGTIERNGACEPADTTTGSAMCGPFTELQGDRCVPVFPPTQCDPATTMETTDENGVVTCVGTGGSSCDGVFACPTPTGATKQTICGQIYDFEKGDPTTGKFKDPMANGTKCDPMTPTTSGPCALQIVPYDAIGFGMNPTGASPLPVESVYIDDCGRYRVTNIDVSSSTGFVGLGFDDAGGPLGNPAGVTVTTAVTTGKQAMTATKDLEAFIVKASTTQTWQTSMGPPLSGGIYGLVFRKHKPGTAADMAEPFAPQPGVSVTKMGNPITANDYYFESALIDRTTIDPAATATGMNGTALVTNASVNDSVSYAGSGGLGTGCRWELHAGASLAGIVYIQIYRKADIIGQTCND
jgi:hypothetical protein